MKHTHIICCSLGLLSLNTYASDVRFCDIEGTVSYVTDDKAPVFDVSVRVSSASREQGDRGKSSQTDCNEFIGKYLPVTLKIPKRFRPPLPGDTVAFSYSVVDSFDLRNGNYVGTYKRATLKKYQRPDAQNER